MHRRSRSLLSDALAAADQILAHSGRQSLDAYLGDAWFRAAVERNFAVIGEALRKLERSDEEIASRIPDIREIIDFRNRIVHGYDSLDHRRVWRFTQEELPVLRDVIISLLESVDEL